MLDLRKCAQCGQDVLWIRSVSGNAIPIDPEPVKDPQEGDLLVIGGVSQSPMGEILTEIFGPERFRHHVRTCPQVKKRQDAAAKLREGKRKP